MDELVERLTFEKDRLEKDEAVYGVTDCDAEMKYYGREVSRVIGVLGGALKELRILREEYRLKNESAGTERGPGEAKKGSRVAPGPAKQHGSYVGSGRLSTIGVSPTRTGRGGENA